MCGICGHVNSDINNFVSQNTIEQMCNAIIHRGPDDEGYYIQKNVGLGMRRLSIIDLVSGAQPIYNEDKSCVIVFNGEIYNHQDIKKELIAKGHHFRTKTDTEVILHAFEEYGEDCPTKLNGMFSFAIWDDREKKLFLARDRLGIKPLYYFVDHKKIIFGSEIKSILKNSQIPRNINRKALDNFLTFEYIPDPLSIFDKIYKLSPGFSLTFQNGRERLKQYWTFQYRLSSKSEEELIDEFSELFYDAVKIRLMSDVPLGAFLSGGLDSSSIVGMMTRANSDVKTFSIGFNDRTYNELPYARQISDHFDTKHYEEFISPDIVRLTGKIIDQLDEPFGDFSVFPTFLVSEMARKYVTVVLSGDGGDELLGGYDTYIADRMARKYDQLPLFLKKGFIEPLVRILPPTAKKKGLINRSRRFVEGLKLPDHLQHVRWMIFLQETEKNSLYSAEFKDVLDENNPYDFLEEKFRISGSNDYLDQQQYVDIRTYLVDDILVKVDRMSMANSLETRVPFLDHRLVEFMTTVPSHYRLNGKTTKYLLKKAMKDRLPESILTRGKEGFSIPIKNWMKNELKPMTLDALSANQLKKTGYFESEYVHRLIDEHLQGRENHSHRLWALLMFQLWYQKHMDN